MPYATQADLELAFGRDNVRAWSNLDGVTTNPDAPRIAAALAWAQDYIDNRLRPGRYALPLEPLDAPLAQVAGWAATLAAWRLYSARGLRDHDDPAGQKLQALRQGVDRELDRLLAGRLALRARPAAAAPDAPVAL